MTDDMEFDEVDAALFERDMLVFTEMYTKGTSFQEAERKATKELREMKEEEKSMAATDQTDKPYGFVLPDELIPIWNQNECTIEDTTDGDAIVLDHSIQAVVYRGRTKKQCSDWLDS